MLIYVKTKEATCANVEDGLIVSLGDLGIECIRGHLAVLNMLVVVLEYSQLQLIVCEFGGFDTMYCIMRAYVPSHIRDILIAHTGLYIDIG